MERKYLKRKEEEVPIEMGISAEAVKKMLSDHKASIDETVGKVIDTVESKIKEVTENVDTKLNDTTDQIIEGFKNTPMVKGAPGKDANEQAIYDKLAVRLPKEDRIVSMVANRFPSEDKIVKKVLSRMPNQKGTLKVIQQKTEIDPMAVIEEILKLPPDKFKLKSSNVDGLEQTISSFNSQLGKGYLHGSGLSAITDLIQPGTNVTFDGTGTQTDPYIVNSNGGGGGGDVSSVFGRTGAVAANSGDYTTALVDEDPGFLYFTDARAITALTGQNISIFTNNSGYITGNQTITLTGPVTGSGTTAITTAIANNVITNAMINSVAWSKITSTPTTLAGYGITDGSSNSLTSAHIFVGNGSNVATDVAMSGNVTISNTGVTTIGTAQVSNSMLAGGITFNKLVINDILSLPFLAQVGTITTGVWNGTDIAIADGGTGASTASGARTNLGLAIGTDVQAFNTQLGQIAGLGAPAGDRIPFYDFSGSSYAFFTSLVGLSISGTTLTATGAVASVTANNSSLTISPNTGAVLAEVNLANSFAWSGTNTHAGTETFNGTSVFTSTVTFTSLPTSSATPSASNEFTTVAYVSALFAGFSSPAKSAVDVASTVAGGNLILLGEQTIDGVTTSASRILVKNQTLPAQNGIYTTGVGAWTRTTDYDSAGEVLQGTFMFVLGGGQAGTEWIMNSPSVTTLGTDPITFAQFGVTTIYTGTLGVQLVGSDFRANLSASGAITLSGNSMQVAVDNSSIEISSNALRVKATGITNAMLAGSIADTKLLTISTAGKVSGAALTSLASIPGGAGIIPVANLGTGTPSNLTVLFGDGSWQNVSTYGNVFGPSSSTDGDFATYDSTTGKVIKDLGLNLTKVSDGGGGFDYEISHSSATNGKISITTPGTSSGSGNIELTTGLANIAETSGSINLTVGQASDPGGLLGTINLVTSDGDAVGGGINFVTGSMSGSGITGHEIRFTTGIVFNDEPSDVIFDMGISLGGTRNYGRLALKHTVFDTFGVYLDIEGITADQNISFPNNSGILALTSDISAYAVGNSSNTEVLFNNAGTVDGIAEATYVTGLLSLVDTGFQITGVGDATKKLKFSANSNSAGVQYTIFTSATVNGSATFPNATGNVLLDSATQTITNKSINASQLTSTVGVANGGTNIASYTIGDMIYASGATALSKLADVAVGNVLRSGGIGVAPAYGKVVLTTDVTGVLPAANMTQTDVQVFTSSGTWTKPTGAKSVHIQMIGGGGGGSSGRKGASGTIRQGGGGGGGGGIVNWDFIASILGSTETVILGAGGNGGASQTINSSDGNNGNNGSASSFGNWMKAGGGAGAIKGALPVLGSGGLAGYNLPYLPVNISRGGASGSSTGTGSTVATEYWGAGSGGGGGAVTAANVAFAGGQGGTIGTATSQTGYGLVLSGGAGGAISNSGGSGSSSPTNSNLGGSGGGGGGSSVTTNAGNGGNGAAYGAGGGGGGAATDGVGNSGAGAAGGNGIVIVTTYF